MKRSIWMFLLVVLSLLVLSGCRSQVVYDNDFTDDVRYKPEIEWDYFQYLGPKNASQIENQNAK